MIVNKKYNANTQNGGSRGADFHGKFIMKGK